MAKKTFQDGSVVIGSTNLQITTADLEEHGKFAETTDTETDQVDGIITREQLCEQKWLTGNVSADYDPDRNPRSDPPNIKTGAEVTLYYKETAERIWTITALVTGVGFPGLAPAGKIAYRFSWASQGGWTEPA